MMNATPTYLPRANIERLAEEFAEKTGYEIGGSLESVVATLRGEIRVQHSPNDGELRVHEDRSFTIFLPPHTAPSRDRFTVAHELGHFVLHSQFGRRPITIARSGSNKVEAEANLFAAALLMPEQEFRRAVRTRGSDGAVASYFDVSTDAVRVRKQVLGISA